MDAPRLSVKDQFDELPTKGESRSTNPFVAGDSSSYQASFCGSQVGSKSDQSQEGLEPDDLLLPHHDRDRRPHQQIRDQEAVDLRYISPVPEISGGIVETERSLGVDPSHSDASVDEKLSDCIEDGPSWEEIDAQCSEDDVNIQSFPIPSSSYYPKTEPQPDTRVISASQPVQMVSSVFCQERDSSGYQIPEESVEHLEKIESENQRNPTLLQIRGIPPPEIRLPKILPSRIHSTSLESVLKRMPRKAKTLEQLEEEKNVLRRVYTGGHDFVFVDYKDHPELNEVHFAMTVNRPNQGEDIPLPKYDKDSPKPPRVSEALLSSISPEEYSRRLREARDLENAYSEEEDDDEDDEDEDDEIQEIETVETHNSQSSEGQLRMPHDIAKVEVIAILKIPYGACNIMLARSDDLLALKAENQPKIDLLGKDEVKSCLNDDIGPDFEVQKSEIYPNCDNNNNNIYAGGPRRVPPATSDSTP
jgi:hypothetical protein